MSISRVIRIVLRSIGVSSYICRVLVRIRRMCVRVRNNCRGLSIRVVVRRSSVISVRRIHNRSCMRIRVGSIRRRVLRMFRMVRVLMMVSNMVRPLRIRRNRAIRRRVVISCSSIRAIRRCVIRSNVILHRNRMISLNARNTL